MPLRDFTCTACGHAFEKLVRHDEAPACPCCGGTELHRELSAFAVGAAAPARASSAPLPAGCGACGGPAGACRFAAEAGG